jgi:hypothetical protein
MNRRICSIVALALACAACGPLKYNLQSTDKAPGADATLYADVRPDQGNTRVDLAVMHLAPPDRIQAGDTAFVSWWRKDDKSVWQRVGALKYDPDARTGHIEAATVPEVAFDLQVCSEKTVDPASPSPVVIFQQHVEKPK